MSDKLSALGGLILAAAAIGIVMYRVASRAGRLMESAKPDHS